MPPKKTAAKSVNPVPVTPASPLPVSKPVAAVPERSEAKGSGPGAKPKPAPRAITHELIAQRAYEIYASRGYAAGDPNADWLEAERQLKAGL